MSTVLTSLPVGERVGIAFSGRARHVGGGGLDAGEGRHPVRLHGRPRPVRRAGPGQACPDAPRATAPRRRAWSTAAPSSSTKGWWRCSAGVPHHHRRPDLLQHHAARAGGHRHAAGASHAGRRRRHLGRRLDVQGQRHRALLPLRPPRQRQPAHLQAVAGRGLRGRARRPSGDERVAQRPGLPTATPRRRPTRPTPTSGGRPTRPSCSSTSTRAWTSSSRSWVCATGTRPCRRRRRRRRSASTRAGRCR